MGIPPRGGRSPLVPLTLLVVAAAIAPAASNAALELPQPVQQAATGLSNPVIDQVQSTIDQAQDALGPAKEPTQGPVDSAQSAIDNAANQGGSGSTPASPSGPTPSSGSAGSRTSRAPRAAGGSATAGSADSPVSRPSGSTARSRAVARRAAARRAAAASAPAATARRASHKAKTGGDSGGGDVVTQAVTKLVKVVPGPIKLAIALLAALAALLGFRSWLHGRRARRLERQREELLEDVGLLQRALLPDVPERIGPLATSVAYRPADGPAAGGDFYDVFEIQDGKVAVIVGDVCGHGRQALTQTALIRYTLRAYIDAGLGPREALQVAGRALANDLAGELTTVVVAVYDPSDATLTYACAGHEPPILLGPAAHEPVVAGAAPPVGAGVETGMRETRVPLPAGSSACFFTDGLVEARIDGGMVGRRRLNEMVSELDGGDAHALLARLAEDAQRAPDDMAACIVRAVEGRPTTAVRVEQLEVRTGDDGWEQARAFLLACGIEEDHARELLGTASLRASEFGAAVLRVAIDARGPRVEVEGRPDVTAMMVIPPVQPGDESNTVAI